MNLIKGIRSWLFKDRIKTRTIHATALDVTLGRVRIYHDAGDSSPIAGYGTHIELNGKPVENVASVEVTIKPDEIITVKIEAMA